MVKKKHADDSLCVSFFVRKFNLIFADRTILNVLQNNKVCTKRKSSATMRVSLADDTISYTEGTKNEKV